MDRYYSTLKNLPTEILLSNPHAPLEDIKFRRWITRDTFLQMSQEPFAAANGIGPDHLQNFLHLQDAIIAKILIQKLENTRKEDDLRKVFGLLQLIFTETPKLIEFLFSSPTNLSSLKLLIENCPALFNLIALLKEVKFNMNFRQNFDSKCYYWQVVGLLTRKYPTQATLDLSKEVIEEIQNELETGHLIDHQILSIDKIITDIRKAFPFINQIDIKQYKRTKIN